MQIVLQNPFASLNPRWRVESILKEASYLGKKIDYLKSLEDVGLKKDILEHIIDVTTKSFALKRSNNDSVEVLSAALPDDSIMVTYRKIPTVYED